MFAGTHTALITPFRDGVLDEKGFRRLIERQIGSGVNGLVPVGTTGESPTLTHAEHQRVIELTVEAAAGRCRVIAGTGSNSTKEAIELTHAAEKAGADASLQVCPYYNKPCQEGLFQHYRAIAESTSLPLILYSIPGRCQVEIGLETTARLHERCPNVVAMKEAGGTTERVSGLRALLPERFEILSGDDSMTLPFMSVGACGVISVASNLIPDIMVRLTSAANEGRWDEAREWHARYYPLFGGLLRLATNPVPIKAAMELAGLIRGDLRLPLVPLAETPRQELKAILQQLELLSP